MGMGFNMNEKFAYNTFIDVANICVVNILF
jgi:hypothetical protein